MPSETECEKETRLSVTPQLRETEFPSGTVLSCGLSVSKEQRTVLVFWRQPLAKERAAAHCRVKTTEFFRQTPKTLLLSYRAPAASCRVSNRLACHSHLNYTVTAGLLNT